MKKVILLSLCWASMLPAMEPKKELSTYEQAMAHNQSNPLLQLPDECLDHIVQYLIGNVTHVQSEDQLQTSVQTIARLQTTCHRFNNLLKGEYPKQLKESLKAALSKLKVPFNLIDAHNRSLFIIKVLIVAGTDVDKQNNDEDTVLTWAIKHDYTAVVEAIIDGWCARRDKQNNYGPNSFEIGS